MSMGSGGGQTTTTQKSDPWSGQQPYLQDVFSQAQNLYNDQSGWPQYFPGSTVAGFNPQETSSLDQLYNQGMNGTSSLNSAGDALTAFNSGAFLSAGNPYFQQMTDAIKANVMPGLQSQFTQGGAMNSPAAAYATAQGLGSAIAPIAYQNYSDQLKNMLTSASLSPGQYDAEMTGSKTALAAGQTQQQQSQQELNDQVNKYTYNQQLPYNMLNQYNNTIQGNYGGTSTLTQPYSNNNTQNIISGLGTAATIAAK